MDHLHLCIPNINFSCPYCGQKYNDADDKYLDRCNRNKTGFTTIKCICQERFGMTYDIKGNAVSFKL